VKLAIFVVELGISEQAGCRSKDNSEVVQSIRGRNEDRAVSPLAAAPDRPVGDDGGWLRVECGILRNRSGVRPVRRYIR
jgi:hypothetical protein